MIETIISVCFGVGVFLFVLIGFIILNIQAERMEIREQEELRKDIVHLPPEIQLQIWLSYYRHQAERDLL